jgi:hypothetical protein
MGFKGMGNLVTEVQKICIPCRKVSNNVMHSSWSIQQETTKINYILVLRPLGYLFLTFLTGSEKNAHCGREK